MADLFSVTAPLLICHPDGKRHVMAELFPHPQGLLYFELFWDRAVAGAGVHLVEGKIRGEGPWKVGECVINLLGCHGSHPDEAAQYATWCEYRGQAGGRYPSSEEVREIARDHGAGI